MTMVAAKSALVAGSLIAIALLCLATYGVRIGASQSFEPGSNSPPGERPGNSPAQPGQPKGGAKEPIPEDESIWEDQPQSDLDNQQRLAQRPGNFEVVGLVGQFLEGVYAIEPDFGVKLAYPFQQDSKVIETAAASAERDREYEAKARASGTKVRNKLRTYNLVVHQMTMINLGENDCGVPNPADLGLSQRELDRFAEIRKRHPERCVLVLLRMGLESLQSEKIEGGDSPSDWILCWVRKSDGWRLAWFEK